MLLEQLERRYALTAPVVHDDEYFPRYYDVPQSSGPLFVTQNDNWLHPSLIKITTVNEASVIPPVGTPATFPLAHGTLTLSSDHSFFFFTHADGFTGTQIFTYRLSEGSEESTTYATVTLHVHPITSFGDDVPSSINEGDDLHLDDFFVDDSVDPPQLVSRSDGPGTLHYYWYLDTTSGSADASYVPPEEDLIDVVDGQPVDHTVSTLDLTWEQLAQFHINDGNLEAILTLKVVDGNGQETLATEGLGIQNHIPEPTTFSMTPAASGGCAGATVTMDATIALPNTWETVTSVSIDWNWDFLDPNDPQPDEELPVTTNSDGTFSVHMDHTYAAVGDEIPFLFINTHNSLSGRNDSGIGLITSPTFAAVTLGLPVAQIRSPGEIGLDAPDPFSGFYVPDTYTWSVTKDGQPFLPDTVAGAHFSYTPSAPGIYVAHLVESFPSLNPDTQSFDDTTIIVGTGGPPTNVTISGASGSRSEGTQISLGSHFDGGCGALTYSWSVEGGPFTGGTPADEADFSFTPSDNGTYIVHLSVNGVPAPDATILVTNVAPTAAPPVDQTANEGASTSFSLGSFSDPGLEDNPWAVDVDWGDGSAHTTFSTASVGSLGSRSHTYADNANRTVTVKVTDKDGGNNSTQFHIAIANVAPVIVYAGTTPGTINETGSTTVNGLFADPGTLDTHTVTIAWGDGSPTTTLNLAAGVLSFSAFHPYLDGTNASVPISVTVKDKDNASATGNTSVLVNNVAPTTAITGAPANSPEGTAIHLGNSTTDPSNADTAAGFTYAWSITKNGNAYASGSGSGFMFTPDDNGTYIVGLTATDKDGGVGIATPATINVTNVAPTALINGVTSGATAGVTTQPLSFVLGANDPSSIDQAAGFSYAINWGDNSQGTASGQAGTSAVHAFATVGTYTVTVTATDKDGGSSVATMVVTISTTLNPPGTLMIGETNFADGIVLHASDIPAGTQKVLIYAGAGDDDIQIAGSITTTVIVFGGPGNDRLKGGSGNNILVGGDGDDLIVGGSGRDILIGGKGSDRIVGNENDDILMGGSTSYDTNADALMAIMNEWRSSRTYTERVANISNAVVAGADASFASRLNSNYFLIPDDVLNPNAVATVFDDNAADTLTGNSGLDWFLFNADGENGTKKDKVTDLTAAEFTSDIDWINAIA